MTATFHVGDAIDHDALAAALDFWQRPENSRELEPDELLICAAARERLAQLPEFVDDSECGDCDHLPRKVYPAALVERLTAALLLKPGNAKQLAVFFLDALGETP